MANTGAWDNYGGNFAYFLIASIGTLSTIMAFAVVAFIMTGIIKSGREFKTYISQNQCGVLVMNLLLADGIMGAGGALGYRWIHMNGIPITPDGWCWTQGAMLQIGDVANAFFVLALGLHTMCTFVHGHAIPCWHFNLVIVTIWTISLVLTLVGPLQHGADFFVSVGDWCWISQEYALERLLLNYVWVFAVEFGAILVYVRLLFFLRKRLNMFRQSDCPGNTRDRLARAMASMTLYPLAFLILTFPMAFSRMQILAGKLPSGTQMLVAGSFVAAFGLVDGLLYSMTRRIFNQKSVPQAIQQRMSGDDIEMGGSQSSEDQPKNDATLMRIKAVTDLDVTLQETPGKALCNEVMNDVWFIKV